MKRRPPTSTLTDPLYPNATLFRSEMSFYAGSNRRRTLEAGFTTVRHLGAREFIDVGPRNAIAANLTPGPRILAAGNAITATGGSCDRAPYPAQRVAPLTPREGVCTGADQRSEEHTSELQSLMRITYAVFRFKKKHTKPTN